MTTKGSRTRRRILDVVVDLLETRSFADVTIAEITRRAEVTRPAFYFHFPTKGAAVAAVLEDLAADFVGVASAWYDHRDADPQAGVADAIDATVALWRSHARLMDAILRAAAVDEEAGRLVDDWVDGLARRAEERWVRDLGPSAPEVGPSAGALARLMVGATMDAMRRDVRSIAASGTPLPELPAALAHAWARVLGGPAAPR